MDRWHELVESRISRDDYHAEVGWTLVFSLLAAFNNYCGSCLAHMTSPLSQIEFNRRGPLAGWICILR